MIRCGVEGGANDGLWRRGIAGWNCWVVWATGTKQSDGNLPTLIYRKERTEARGSPRRGSPSLGYPTRLVKVAKVGRNKVKTELASLIAGLESFSEIFVLRFLY